MLEELERTITRKKLPFDNYITIVFRKVFSEYIKIFLETSEIIKKLPDKDYLDFGNLRNLLLHITAYDSELMKIANHVIKGERSEFKTTIDKLGKKEFFRKSLDKNKHLTLEQVKDSFSLIRGRLASLYTELYKNHLRDEGNIYRAFLSPYNDVEILSQAGVNIKHLEKIIDEMD